MAHGAEQQRSLIRPRQAPGTLAHGGIGPEPIQIDAERDARHLACADIVVVDVVLPPLLRSSHHRSHAQAHRSEEHTSELQSLMRNSYAVFCLKKKKKTHTYLDIILVN